MKRRIDELTQVELPTSAIFLIGEFLGKDMATILGRVTNSTLCAIDRLSFEYEGERTLIEEWKLRCLPHSYARIDIKLKREQTLFFEKVVS